MDTTMVWSCYEGITRTTNTEGIQTQASAECRWRDRLLKTQSKTVSYDDFHIAYHISHLKINLKYAIIQPFPHAGKYIIQNLHIQNQTFRPKKCVTHTIQHSKKKSLLVSFINRPSLIIRGFCCHFQEKCLHRHFLKLFIFIKYFNCFCLSLLSLVRSIAAALE